MPVVQYATKVPFDFVSSASVAGCARSCDLFLSRLVSVFRLQLRELTSFGDHAPSLADGALAAFGVVGRLGGRNCPSSCLPRVRIHRRPLEARAARRDVIGLSANCGKPHTDLTG